MKRITLSAALILMLSAFAIPAFSQVDKEKENKEKVIKDKEKKDVETIVITRKGGSEERMVVEVVGDKVTVNGKPVEELKDGNVSVRRSKGRAPIIVGGGSNSFDVWNEFDMNNHQGYMFDMDEDYAMLGVVTEKVDEGAEINEITKGSGAEKAGLKTGDIITKVNEAKITSPDELSKAIRKHKPGEKVTVHFLRSGKSQSVTAELGKWSSQNAFALPKSMPRVMNPPNYNLNYSYTGAPKLGLSVQDTDDGKGVKVLEVDDDGNAAKAGIEEGDVITHVNETEITGADQMAKVVKANKDKGSMNVKLKRNGKTQNIEVKMPKKLKTVDM